MNMAQDTVSITVQGKDQREVIQKANGLGILAEHLDGKTLDKLAYVVVNQPMKVKMAKKALGIR